MPKNAKSSASSATRKKKAQKAAATKGGADTNANGKAQPTQRGQKKGKGKNKEPKKKVYIPPVKPKGDVIDPLDSLGLASLLPSDLVVILRKAGKKDVVTRSRALEGLIDWVRDDTLLQDTEVNKSDALVMAIPCWAHLFPRLSVSPNRRLRQLASQCNSLFLSDARFFEELVHQLENLQAVVGAMFILAFDPDRPTSRSSKSTWEQYTGWDTTAGKLNLYDHLDFLLSHISAIVFHQSDDTSSQAVKATLDTSRDVKNRDDGNVEEDGEGVDARLVYCAIGALSWLIASQPIHDSGALDTYSPLMTSPTLWTSLSQQLESQHERCLGILSPIVRSAAWNLIRTMAQSWKELLHSCTSMMGYRALVSAFAETDVSVASQMRDGLITMLRERPEIWQPKGAEDEDLEDGDETDEEDEHSESESGSGASGSGEALQKTNGIATEKDTGPSKSFTLYEEFLTWLSNGLAGVHSNYNIVILLLSTIPQVAFPPTSTAALPLLEAMYRPIDERLIEGREALRNFLPALVECIVWTSARVKKLTSTQEAVIIVVEMTRLFCNDFIGTIDTLDLPEVQSRALSLGEDRLRAEAATLLRKIGGIDMALGSILLQQISSSLGQSTLNKATLLMDRNIDILRLASTTTQGGATTTTIPTSLQEAIYQSVRDLCMTTAHIVASGEAQIEGTYLLSTVLERMPDALDQEATSSLQLVFDRLLQGDSTLSAQQQTAFHIPYIISVRDVQSRNRGWVQLLDSLCKNDAINWDLLSALMLSNKGREDQIELVDATRLDAAIQRHHEGNREVTSNLLRRPRPFLQQGTVSNLLTIIAQQGDSYSLSMLAPWLEDNPSNVQFLFQHATLSRLMPMIITEALLHKDGTAERIWNVVKSQPEANAMAGEVLNKQLQSLDEPLLVVTSAIRQLPTTLALSDALPSRDIFMRHFKLAQACHYPVTMNIHDQLIDSIDDSQETIQYDKAGLSSYCRCSLALLEVIEETGSKAAWTLPHLISLAVAAEDAEISYLGGKSHFATTTNELTNTINRAVRAATSALSSHCNALDEAWYSNATKVLKSNTVNDTPDELLTMLVSVWITPHSARVFSRLLKGLINFNGAGEKESTHLLRLGQAIQDVKPNLASAIYIAIKDVIVESPVYDRIRNELAARLAGIPPSKASTEGIKILRLLISVAPPEESSLALIPQQRSIFLLQTLQKWIASDESEDFPPQLHSLLMQLLSHLLPIVQDMPGSHLAFMCDMMDVNLSEGMENPSCVYHSLVLVEQFSSLAARNAMLREVWNESKKDIFENVHDLFLKQEFAGNDALVSTISDALADAVRAAPESLFTSEKEVDPLLHLIKMAPRQTQILAYRLLSNNIRERVKELVVEIAIGVQKEISSDQEEDHQGAMLLQAKVDPVLIERLLALPQGTQKDDFSFILAWLSLFDHFEESSLQVKAMYTSQIQNLALVEKSLLTFFFSTMDIRFDPSRWALDEVYLDEMESSEEALQVLTAHIFYRSLIHIPNLIRESFNGIKDRQESLYLRSFIMRHLSPLLAHREFSHLRDATIVDRLIDENMTIKVLAGSNEVIATYTVDEYPLEISIAMPNDYPLHNVEIKDLKKVGVSEGTWRAWILSIRQLIGSRNGLIFDALMLFKRNVEAKFSGFDEDSTCAVCYSIVSPTDHSLPTKPCKTCKKKFHASCLYKWVSTSGSSTCPLCRSIL